MRFCFVSKQTGNKPESSGRVSFRRGRPSFADERSRHHLSHQHEKSLVACVRLRPSAGSTCPCFGLPMPCRPTQKLPSSSGRPRQKLPSSSGRSTPGLFSPSCRRARGTREEGCEEGHGRVRQRLRAGERTRVASPALQRSYEQERVCGTMPDGSLWTRRRTGLFCDDGSTPIR